MQVRRAIVEKNKKGAAVIWISSQDPYIHCSALRPSDTHETRRPRAQTPVLLTTCPGQHAAASCSRWSPRPSPPTPACPAPPDRTSPPQRQQSGAASARPAGSSRSAHAPACSARTPFGAASAPALAPALAPAAAGPDASARLPIKSGTGRPRSGSGRGRSRRQLQPRSCR